jgi:hypothetical protein
MNKINGNLAKDCPHCGMSASISLSKLFSPLGKRRIATCPWCKNELKVSSIPWLMAILGFGLFIFGILNTAGYLEYSIGSFSLDAVAYWGGFIFFVLGLWNMKYVSVGSTSNHC